MSVWKEIRCDALPFSDDCFNNRNQGPKGFETIGKLHNEARTQGWRISLHEAICPNCRALNKR